MKLKLIDLFKRITWAKNGDLTDFSQTNYEAGWAHLGDDTPTVQDFNYVQQMNDKKDQWLFNQLKAVLEKAQIEPTEENVNSLRDAILALSKGFSTPKEITAETVNFVDKDGHTHSIALASLTQKGIVQLTNDTELESESLALTAKAGKKLAQQTAQLQLNISQNYIPNSKKSSAVNSNSSDTVATSAAVKTAYDKGVEAKTAADNAQSTANSKQSPATTLAGYGIGNFKIENFVGDVNTLQTDGIYAVTQASRSQNLPVAGNDCHIQVIAGGDGRWCRQIAYIAYSTDMYERHQTSYQTDSWSGWTRIDVRDEFNALKDIFIGIPIPYPLSTVPTGCLAMNGQRFDTRRYPKLAQKYPSGQLPDLRGEFIRGWDNGRGVDAGRGMLSVQSDEIKSHNHKFKYIGQNQRAESNRTDIFNQLTVGDSVYRHDRRDDLIIKVANESDVKYGKTPYNDVSIYINNTGGAETRPRNIAYHYICLAE